jgi:putative lipoprotein
MKKVWLSLVAGWLIILIGCSERNQEIETSDIKQTLVGEAYYRERKLLPSGAELHLTLEDVSKMDVPSSVIATSIQPLTGTPPYEFKLGYFETDVDSQTQYNLRGTITFNGKLLFTSTEQLNPFREPEKDIVIILSMVSATNEHPPTVTFHDVDTGLAVVSVDPLAELSNTYWKLVSLNENDVAMAEKQKKEAFLQLRADNNSVKGFGGCNAFTGGYKVNGNDLNFGPLVATGAACMAGMNTESDFMQALDVTTYYSIHKETLTLLSDQRQPVARFKAMYFN